MAFVVLLGLGLMDRCLYCSFGNEGEHGALAVADFFCCVYSGRDHLGQEISHP